MYIAGGVDGVTPGWGGPRNQVYATMARSRGRARRKLLKRFSTEEMSDEWFRRQPHQQNGNVS